MAALRLIFRCHRQSRYSVAALLGAVETDPRLADLQVEAPSHLTVEHVRTQAEAGPVILAFSVMSTQLQRVTREVRKLRRELGKSVSIVAGGPHASTRPRDLLNSGVDYVVVGEGEYAFPELLSQLMNGGSPESVRGVVTESTEKIPTPRSLPKVQLDSYPPFAVGLNLVGPVEVTRGCPFRCRFCATPFLTGGSVRHRSVEQVVHWLQMAVEKRGFRRTWFLSPNALCYGGTGRKLETAKLERLLHETSEIESLREIFFGAFPSEVRPEFVTRDALVMMRQYVANKSIQIGLQSGSDRVLEVSNRHHTVQQGIDAVRTALDCGFVPHVDIIFGLPGEVPDDVQRSLDVCQSVIDMGGRIHSHVFMPLPGSDFEDMPPGRLDASTRHFLGEMSTKGLLTGSWSQQERLGQSLSRRK